MVFIFSAFFLVKLTDSMVFFRFGFARLGIKSGISDELGYGRKFLDVAANLGEDDSGKSFAHARYRLKFGIKARNNSSNL